MTSRTPQYAAASGADPASAGVDAIARPSLRPGDAIALVVGTVAGGELAHLLRGSPSHPWTATRTVQR